MSRETCFASQKSLSGSANFACALFRFHVEHNIMQNNSSTKGRMRREKKNWKQAEHLNEINEIEVNKTLFHSLAEILARYEKRFWYFYGSGMAGVLCVPCCVVLVVCGGKMCNYYSCSWSRAQPEWNLKWLLGDSQSQLECSQPSSRLRATS